MRRPGYSAGTNCSDEAAAHPHHRSAAGCARRAALRPGEPRSARTDRTARAARETLLELNGLVVLCLMGRPHVKLEVLRPVIYSS